MPATPQPFRSPADSGAPMAVVTGSESGIGRATAVALAQHGFDIGVTWHRSREAGAATVDEVRSHGRRGEMAALDLADAPAAAATVDALGDKLGRLDVLVNCAAEPQSAAFLELGLDEWRRVIDVDLTGTFAVAQAAARRMARQGGGRIINVTSVHEHIPLRRAAAYCAAKGGLGMLTKVMALELAEHSILVNAVAPGAIATAMTGAEDVDPRQLERPGIAVGRPGDAREIAAAIAFLAGPGARYVTGHSFVVDGGMLLMAAEASRLAAD
jgi:NAD(P)-dependent dehydrogenase (short-subunit alcohol dehydrogenase family)